MNKISKQLIQNKKALDSILVVDKNFDIIGKDCVVGGVNAYFYFIDGFIKDEMMEKIIEFFYNIPLNEMEQDPVLFLKNKMPYIEAQAEKHMEKVIANLLSGVFCLFIDGYDACILIDSRSYPVRSVEEPEKDKVLRGSRDGFVETVVFNTALIRRRIRSPKLRFEMLQAGESSKTDIVVCYMDERVDYELLEKVKERIQKLKVDALTMNQESLAECLYRRKWYNPFPKFKYTERPDTASASLLEGNIIILVDNSPSAMILPTSIFDIIEEADDYYFPPITGTYLRFSRFAITLITLLLTPVWLLLMKNPAWIPEWLQFIQIKEAVHIPIIWQLLILEFSIDGLRLAAINTPSMLSTPLSVIAGLVVGEFAVSSGWFNAESMLYMAFVAISSYTQASYELGYALKFMRFILLILTAIANIWGFIIGIGISIFFMVTNRTISGKSYLYPFIPFNWKELKKKLFRARIPHTME